MKHKAGKACLQPSLNHSLVAGTGRSRQLRELFQATGPSEHACLCKSQLTHIVLLQSELNTKSKFSYLPAQSFGYSCYVPCLVETTEGWKLGGDLTMFGNNKALTKQMSLCLTRTFKRLAHS